MRREDAQPGLGVVYTPAGNGRREDGVVTSVGREYVFVRFRPTQEHGIAVPPALLEVLS